MKETQLRGNQTVYAQWALIRVSRFAEKNYTVIILSALKIVDFENLNDSPAGC